MQRRAFGLLIVLLTACGGGAAATMDGGDPQDPQPQIQICHREGEHVWTKITINANALDSHLKHGDIYPVPKFGCPGDGHDTTTTRPEHTTTTKPEHVTTTTKPGGGGTTTTTTGGGGTTTTTTGGGGGTTTTTQPGGGGTTTTTTPGGGGTTTTTTTQPPSGGTTTTTTTTQPPVVPPPADTVLLRGATTVCRAEVPTIVITFGNAFPELAGNTGTLTMSDVNGNVVSSQPLVYAPGTTVELLYPGTRVNADGSIADVPGWNLTNAGLWVRDPADEFLREGILLTFEVNPVATAFITYPPESSICANPENPPTTRTPPPGAPPVTTQPPRTLPPTL